MISGTKHCLSPLSPVACVVVAVLLLSSGCSQSERSLEWELHEYLRQTLGGSDIVLPSGYSARPNCLGIDRGSGQHATHVIADLSCRDSVPESIFDGGSAKRDMRYIGELVIGFAKQQQWDNSYYLYVKLSSREFEALYDYERDRVWLPMIVLLLEETYREFGTLDLDQIASTEDGVEYLRRNDLADERHGELEIDELAWFRASRPVKRVFINPDGKFFDR